MATTVNGAFEAFMKDKVNLDSKDTKNARTSRDWLIARIHEFPSKDSSFPVIYQEKVYLASKKCYKRQLKM